jgi:ActR/RegA family two-component response regulator
MVVERSLGVSRAALRKKFRTGMTSRSYRDKEAVFSQGDQADSVFYVESGTVKLTAVTVVSAMRHTQPNAVTIVLSGYPAVQEAMAASLLEADEVLMKPVGPAAIAEIIQKKLSNPSARISMRKERVAEILERDAKSAIRSWMSKVEQNDELSAVPLGYQERTGHLPLLLSDLVCRLRLPPDAQPPISRAAREHGILRHEQGYTVPMVVEESRILQVSIFSTLQDNLPTIDIDTVLLDVMTIADEVDSQLKQMMLGFMENSASASASSPA